MRSLSVEVDSGTYRITCNARADGEGVFIYAKMPDDRHNPSALAMIPACGNEGGKIWEEAGEKMKVDTIPASERQRQKEIFEANGGKGFGWSQVELIVNVDKRSTLCYGVSTWDETTETPNQAHWFSACDFKLEKVETDSIAK